MTESSANSGAESTYRKRAIPGPVKVAVIRRYGAKPGGTTQAACYRCGNPGLIWWTLTFTGKIGCHITLRGLEFDHIYPEFRGGESIPENLDLACLPCNRGKRDKVI